MSERYRVVLEGQLGPRTGTLELDEQGGRITGTLSILGFDNPVSGERVGEGRLCLRHDLRTEWTRFPCESLLEVEEGRLSGAASGAGARMLWHGETEEGAV